MGLGAGLGVGPGARPGRSSIMVMSKEGEMGKSGERHLRHQRIHTTTSLPRARPGLFFPCKTSPGVKRMLSPQPWPRPCRNPWGDTSA